MINLATADVKGIIKDSCRKDDAVRERSISITSRYTEQQKVVAGQKSSYDYECGKFIGRSSSKKKHKCG